MNDIKPLVSVFCATYNHEKYIRQCLEGFVMQKTTFQIEVIVQDDASTDGTSKIVNEYSERYSFIIPIILKENIYSQGKDLNEYFYKNARGKYIAICEGDDYWTDPYKLQKQVDFLEANEEFVICSHRHILYFQNSGIYEDDPNGNLFENNESRFDFNIDDWFHGWYLQALDVVFRKDALDFIFLANLQYVCDVSLFYIIMKKGKGSLFSFLGAVYRKHETGIYSSASDYIISQNHYKIYKELYEIDKSNNLKEKYIYYTLASIKYYLKDNTKISVIYLFKLINDYMRLVSSYRQFYQLIRVVIKYSIYRIVTR